MVTREKVSLKRDAAALRRVVALINSKGGVFKTTLASNIGGLLAASDYKVLLVDLDPQGNVAEDLATPTPSSTTRDATLRKHSHSAAHSSRFAMSGQIWTSLPADTTSKQQQQHSPREHPKTQQERNSPLQWPWHRSRTSTT